LLFYFPLPKSLKNTTPVLCFSVTANAARKNGGRRNAALGIRRLNLPDFSPANQF
jgi:hypothetical protein